MSLHKLQSISLRKSIFKDMIWTACVQKRSLSLHEYQAQDILRQAGAYVPRGSLARTADEVEKTSRDLGSRCVLKSQILSGGRGKGVFKSGLKGGIQVVDSPEKARGLAGQMLGHQLVTKQTQEGGLLVDKLYVAEAIKYKEEYYLGITIDRATCRPVLIISKQGGVNIEDAASSNPNSLLRLPIAYTDGITSKIISEMESVFSLDQSASQKLGDLTRTLWRVFQEKDATLLEINPLVRTEEDDFICLDTKLSIDEAASRRQPDLFEARDKSEQEATEIEAEQAGLVYVRLGGNIGNVVNGAGLAMATNDAISYYGGKSANFLDTGGQATTKTMTKAFEIILKDPSVRSILVNIYGGIIRCDMIAESIIAAAAEFGSFKIPVIVRLQGTNAEEGRKMVAESGLDLIVEAEFGAAALRAVAEANRS